ncbi:MAG: hypothetical protein WDN00_06175 [Limisphaerales bacterium]
MDPTYSHQGGSLWNYYLPPYGKALVVQAGNNELEDVPRSRPENAWRQKATSIFTIRSYESPVTFTVRTEYYGASADDMRDDLSSHTADERAKNYLNYYARFYPGTSLGSPLKITDDRMANILTIEENYEITNFWKLDKTEKLRNAQFYAENLYNALTDPDTRIRKNPLALSYPSLRQQSVIVHLPDSEWQIPDLQTNIEHEAFSFNYSRKLQGSNVTFSYECRTKLAAIPAAGIAAYLVSREHMEDLLTDTLQHGDEETNLGTNWLTVVIALFGVGFTLVAGIWYWRRFVMRTKPEPPLLTVDPKLQGLGGWLILVGLGLCLGPVIRLVTIGQNGEAYFSLHVWQSVANTPGCLLPSTLWALADF